eukprot:5412005-Pyramimonas_sp.AAC.1
MAFAPDVVRAVCHDSVIFASVATTVMTHIQCQKGTMYVGSRANNTHDYRAGKGARRASGLSCRRRRVHGVHKKRFVLTRRGSTTRAWSCINGSPCQRTNINNSHRKGPRPCCPCHNTPASPLQRSSPRRPSMGTPRHGADHMDALLASSVRLFAPSFPLLLPSQPLGVRGPESL